MGIRRAANEVESNFTTIPNSWVRDTRLSFKARGLLAMLLSHKAGWNVTISSLAAQNKEGKDAILSAVRELECFGYLVRETSRVGGKYDADWVLKDPPPAVEDVSTVAENPPTVADKPRRFNRDGLTATENPPLKKNSNKKTNTKKTIGKEESATNALDTAEEQPLHRQIAEWVYESTNGSINFMAVSNVVNHHLKRGREPRAVANACLALYNLGKPITNQTLGQMMDNKFNQPQRNATFEDKVQSMVDAYNQIEGQL